jgi:hypothetical protein
MQVRRIDAQTCVLLSEMPKTLNFPNSQKKPASRPRRVALIGAIALVALGAGIANAQKAKTPALPPLLVLGASSQTALPACPGDPCQAIGKVTGFQTAIGKAGTPFVAPYDGRIVAWSIKLSAPTPKQAEFFTDFYGGEPSARIAILKPIKKRRNTYKLRNQTPVEPLKDVLGQTTTFTLRTPMTIRKGQIVGLSVPTWAPAFGIGLAKGNNWLASRQKTKCGNSGTAEQQQAAIKAGSAQEAAGTMRTYGCTYTTARLLYSATLVKSAVGAPPPPKKPAQKK